jgi:hypothetical protein
MRRTGGDVGRADRRRGQTARQAFELRMTTECGCQGASDMPALRQHEAQAVPGDAKITDLNCSYFDLARPTQPRPAA